MHILLLWILIPILIILFIVLMIAGNVIRLIFSGFGFKRNNSKKNNTSNNRTYTAYEKRSKVFGPNEGEYVEFEEIKDND